MPPARRVPKGLRSGPFALSTGLSVVPLGQLRGPGFRRLIRGVYQEAGAPKGYAEKVRAMRLVLPIESVLAGLGAARAHGVFLARPSDPVEFVCPPRRVRPRDGLVVRADRLRADEIVMTPFGPATSPARTAFDLARTAAVPRAAARELLSRLRDDDVRLAPEPPTGAALFGFPDVNRLRGERPEDVASRLAVAVSRVDAVLRAAKLPADNLDSLIARHQGARGLWSARLVAAMADPRAESPPESVLRVRLVLSGLPRPEPQYEIHDAAGKFVARPDLSWEEFQLSAEYDGAYHEERPQVRRDRKRDVAGHKVSWRLLHFDSSDLKDVPTLIRDTHTVMLQRRTRG